MHCSYNSIKFYSRSINKHIVKHGDGVKVIAIWVDDATKSWQETTKEEQNPI